MPQSNLIARQPILNSSLKVIGFELLYRMNSTENSAVINNQDSATIDVLLAAYNDLSINDVVGNQLAFVNFSSNLLQVNLPPIPPKQLVIELLENQDITPELIKSLKQLRKKGYKIALDDFCLNKETIALIDCADIIKLDVLEEAPSKWKNYIPKLHERGIKLLAEKVENQAIYQECLNLKFDFFQGYFFSKPKIITGKKMSRNEMSVINLISKLNGTAVNFDEVVQLISADIDLSYNLLRTVNSGMYSLHTKIDSIRQASVILGLDNLRNWINFLALSSLDNKPQILLDTAMSRAKMCELVGEVITKKPEPDGYFTVGLFSLIDSFFDMPMEGLLKRLSLRREINEALLEQKGIIGEVLKAVIGHQEGKIYREKDRNLLKKYGIDDATMTQLYLSSIIWVNESKH